MNIVGSPWLTLLLIAGDFLSSIEANCSGYAGSCGSKFSGASCTSLEGCIWSSWGSSCSGSPRPCSSYTSENSCNGSFGSCYWNGTNESDENDSSSINSKCGPRGNAFQLDFMEKHDQFEPICSCTPGEKIVCRDQCKRCNSQGVCAKTWKSESYREDMFGGVWTSYIFDVEDDVKDEQDGALIVEYYLYPAGIPPGSLCRLNIGDQNSKCNSCHHKLCGRSDARRGFDLDCSNLGYGAEIDTCEEYNLEYPFQLLNGMEKLALSENAQAKDCEVVEGASSGAVELYQHAMAIWSFVSSIWLLQHMLI